ncbi:MAG TPA: AAA family ATPase [Candidatus Limnocylindrales bacterium]|nr:AAA family ATPase [Candidatus Limnocylindrales bacterium]
MKRPVLFVLAGVNGAGKSSIGGYHLERQKLTWFNPDTFARELVVRSGCSQDAANERAWQEGLRRLDAAIATRRSYAFETTLGGKTITARLLGATATHDVEMWYCGLATPEMHLSRVRIRVAAGGHDIPEPLIRARYLSSQRNLIELMPHLTFLRVYDNSFSVAPGSAIPDPVLVMEIDDGELIVPDSADRDALLRVPTWARPLVQAALELTDVR